MHDVTFIAAYKSCSLPFAPKWMYMFISPTLILLTLIFQLLIFTLYNLPSHEKFVGDYINLLMLIKSVYIYISINR